MNRIIVYTAVLDKQPLFEPPPRWRQQANFIVFQDHLDAPIGWERRPFHHESSDPIRNLLHHKILCHKYFPSSVYSLWVDPSIIIKSRSTLEQWIHSALGQLDLAAFKQPERNCCYLEAALCIERRQDSTQIIDRQMQHYSDKGYPSKNGVIDGRVLLRRHTSAISRFNACWHQQIQAYSRCEQLSFGFAVKQAGIKCSWLPGPLAKTSHFKIRRTKQSAAHPEPGPSTLERSFERPDAIILAHPRSGTHFLQASLASHPRVFGRDEFLVIYRNFGTSELNKLIGLKRYVYKNKPRAFNIGIIMYEDIQTYTEFFGPLTNTKVIHLVRNAKDVVRSNLQMLADRERYQGNFRKHFTLEEKMPMHAPITMDILCKCRDVAFFGREDAQVFSLQRPTSFASGFADIQRKVEAAQLQAKRALEHYPHKFEINYDELTKNTQLNKLPKEFCVEILKFLGLDYHPLTNNLRKTGPGN